MIIAVDFDGTLAITNYPTIICPKHEVIEWCKAQKSMGDTLILWTCRHGKPLDEAVEWCRNQGLIFDYVNESPRDRVYQYGDTRKVYADVYLDDHNLLISEIKEFV